MAEGSSDWEARWDFAGVLDYIERRKLQRVALQFPDELLGHAVTVCEDLQTRCDRLTPKARVYLLADTTYNSLGVDEVAAAHVDAQAVIHYGRASLSPVTKLPAYFVFGRSPLGISECAAQLADYAAAPLNPDGLRAAVVLLDQPLLWALPELRDSIAALRKAKPAGLDIVYAEAAARSLEPKAAPGTPIGEQSMITAVDERNLEDRQIVGCCTSAEDTCAGGTQNCVGEVYHGTNDPDSECMGGYRWKLPPGVTAKEAVWIWVGPDDAPALVQLQMTLSECEWAMLEPDEGRWQDGVPLDISRSLRRRYYLVERAKNASIVGILVGTLGAAGYLEAAEGVRRIAKAAGKQTYTFLMGKPTPAKLANFPEVEVFVHIADPQGQILDSKQFLAPIITPYEAQLAFVPGAAWGGRYELDFGALRVDPERESAAVNANEEEPRFSLLDGRYHGSAQRGLSGEEVPSNALAEQRTQELLRLDPSQHHLVDVDSGAAYLRARRTFQGLEVPALGKPRTAVEPAKEGLSGRAWHYAGEQPST